MQRLVAGAPAGNQRDLARLQLPAADEFVAIAKHENVGMGGDEAVEAFYEHAVDGVDQLLQWFLPGRGQPALPAILLMR